MIFIQQNSWLAALKCLSLRFLDAQVSKSRLITYIPTLLNSMLKKHKIKHAVKFD